MEGNVRAEVIMDVVKQDNNVNVDNAVRNNISPGAGVNVNSVSSGKKIYFLTLYMLHYYPYQAETF